MHKKEKALYLSHWLKAKEDVKNGTITHCFSEDLTASQESEGPPRRPSRLHFRYSPQSRLRYHLQHPLRLRAGHDPLILYPHVQKKAQELIDRVIGPDRLPTMEDEMSLQYVRAIIKETLRWMPTTILGAVPHAVTQDDYYNGMLVPKNAGVLNNVWSIHMDPERHPEPRTFDPERYAEDFQSLGDAAAANPDASKRDQFTFGAGRRICPGIYVAERSLFLGVSRILWGFNIEAARDGKGEPIIPDQEKLTQGFVCMPEDFPASITPRSEARKKAMVDEWKAAEAEGLDPVTKQWKSSPLETLAAKPRTKA